MENLPNPTTSGTSSRSPNSTPGIEIYVLHENQLENVMICFNNFLTYIEGSADTRSIIGVAVGVGVAVGGMIAIFIVIIVTVIIVVSVKHFHSISNKINNKYYCYSFTMFFHSE